MKILMKRLFAIGLLGLSAGTVHAALYVDIIGQSGSSIVDMTVWGSGTWGRSEIDDVIRFDNIKDGFAGNAFNNHGSLTRPEDDDWIDISGFTLNTYDIHGKAVSYNFDRLLIESDNHLDDFLYSVRPTQTISIPTREGTGRSTKQPSGSTSLNLGTTPVRPLMT